MANGTPSKGITITGKNLLTWSAIILIIIGSIVDSALMRDQVARNTKVLDEYNIPVMNEKVITMSDDVKEIKTMVMGFIDQYNENQH